MPPAPLTSGTTRTTAACRPANLYRGSIRGAIGAIEVGLVATLDKGLIVIEVFPALDGNGTGVRSRLPLHLGLGLRPRRARGLPVVVSRPAPRWLGKPELLALFFKQSFARKLDAIALDAENLDQYLVPFTQFVLHVFHAMLGNFADVQQAIGAGENFDKCAELSQAHHLAQIGLAKRRSRQ